MKSEIFYEFPNLSVLATNLVSSWNKREKKERKRNCICRLDSSLGLPVCNITISQMSQMKCLKNWLTCGRVSKATTGKFALCYASTLADSTKTAIKLMNCTHELRQNLNKRTTTLPPNEAVYWESQSCMLSKAWFTQIFQHHLKWDNSCPLSHQSQECIATFFPKEAEFTLNFYKDTFKFGSKLYIYSWKMA